MRRISRIGESPWPQRTGEDLTLGSKRTIGSIIVQSGRMELALPETDYMRIQLLKVIMSLVIAMVFYRFIRKVVHSPNRISSLFTGA